MRAAGTVSSKDVDEVWGVKMLLLKAFVLYYSFPNIVAKKINESHSFLKTTGKLPISFW